MNRKSQNPNSSRESAALAILGRIRGGRLLILRVLEAITWPLGWRSKRPQGDLEHVERILVYAPGQLGDLMMLTPFFRGIRARFPGAHVAVLGNEKLESLLLNQKLADELIPVRTPWGEHSSAWRKYNPVGKLWPNFLGTLWGIRKQKFDLSFMPGFSDLRHNLTLWLAGAKRRTAFAYAGGASLLTDAVQPDLSRPHYADLGLQLLDGMGIAANREDMYLQISREEQASADEFLHGHGIAPGDMVIGIHPGARIAVRQWGEEKFRQIARRAANRWGAKVLWFTDPAAARTGETESGVIEVSVPLRQFLAVLARCRLLVCNDSGPMHMAAALGVRTVAIFGPNHPEWFGPMGHGHRVVIRGDIWCRPCSDECLFDQPYCLSLIPVEQVLDAVTEVLEAGVARENVGELSA